MKPSRLWWSVLATLFISCCSSLSFGDVRPQASSDLVVERYSLDLRLNLEQRSFGAKAFVSFRNRGITAVRQVPFMLYRLLRVQKAVTSKGEALPFRQQVVSMQDAENWQVNEVTVDLANAVPPGQTGAFQVEYAGTIAGYPEVMPYVKDQVDERYSLFRAETLPYPVLGVASMENWRRIYRSPFTYEVRLTVPKDYLAVCGGTPTTQQPSTSGVEFTCTASEPQSQLNIAVAKFALAEDAASQLRVYSLPEDAASGTRVLTELKRAIDFYTSYFGPRSIGSGMNVIEIPDNWGSYTGNGFIFQSAAAFKDPKQNVELYHEVAHRWNAVADPAIQRCRWFDEAFASYFQALALRALSGEQAYVDDLQRSRKYFTRVATKMPKAAEVAIADYGKNDMGDLSYSKGAWSLYVLHQVLGEDTFRHAVSKFLKDFESKPATFGDFRRVVEQAGGRDLSRYFDEWITGTESSGLLISGTPLSSIVERYKGPTSKAAEAK